MNIPSYSLRSASHSNPESVALYGVIPSPDGVTVAGPGATSELTSTARTVKASSSIESITRISSPSNPMQMVVLVGLGSVNPSPDDLRLAAGAATRQLSDVTTIELRFPAANDSDVLAALEGALLGCYTFDRFKSGRDEQTLCVESIVAITDLEISSDTLRRVGEKVSAIHLIKDLVNTPAAEMTPEILAATALEHAEALPISTKVWDERALRDEGFGGIAGVGAGSDNPPRLVRLDYAPAGATRHVSLVGKGITFDTGGLTLKSGTGMVGMKYDMTGAATALAVVCAAAQLQAPIRVTAWLCLAENMPSPSATRPNDVLRIRNGKTVEVLNTDAEGRLVLADGLSAASEEHPDLIIDIATLTGAARGALGTRTVGAMGNTDDVSRLVESAQSSGEQFWRMPLPSELRTLLNSDIADMINGRPGNTTAGMLLAAVFLSEFVGEIKDSNPPAPIPWIHLDIAGTADNPGSAYGFTSAGPTGVTARALIDFILAGA